MGKIEGSQSSDDIVSGAKNCAVMAAGSGATKIVVQLLGLIECDPNSNKAENIKIAKECWKTAFMNKWPETADAIFSKFLARKSWVSEVEKDEAYERRGGRS